jgi:hypothetical protein
VQSVDTLMKSKDIFGLAVRLLGLYFLYLGLYAIAQLLGSDIADIVKNPDKTDLVNSLMPVVFDLVIGWLLLKGGWLIRRAYPETSRPSENLPVPVKRTTSLTESAPSPEPAAAGMDQAEKKLAALVEKPK